MKQLFQIGPQYLGKGRVKFAWQPSGNLVAVVGEGMRNVFLFDRTGSEIISEIPLTPKQGADVICLEWDPEGDLLAILQNGDAVVNLWSVSTQRTEVIEVSSKDPTFLSWTNMGKVYSINSELVT